MKTKSHKTKLILLHLVLFAVIGTYVVLVNKTALDCPSKMLLGLTCPFCGMTRAHLSALRLDFSSAFSFHPVFPLALPTVFFAFHKNLFPCITQRIYNTVLSLIGVLFLVVHLFRL